jgi:CHAT domain-containing protein
VFAGANDPKAVGRGIVTGEALVDLDLSGLELVVLSACETGLGEVNGGEGVFGLQRAFHLAGTRNVVCSLWKVPDRTTAALMGRFYHHLWEDNVPPLQALRKAQLDIYRNPDKTGQWAKAFRGATADSGPDTKVLNEKTAHPLMWAAFTLSGVGR